MKITKQELKIVTFKNVRLLVKMRTKSCYFF